MSLPNEIYRLDSFQRELKNLIQKSVRSVFGFSSDEENDQEIDWKYLLLCASALSHSDVGAHQDAAFRIAQTCMSNLTTEDSLKIASSVVFHNLTNNPAIQLAIKKDLLPADFETELPLPLRMEQTKRNFEHIVYLKSGDIQYLNKFQKLFYESIKEVNYVSASAPTSAGKSFALNLFVTEKLSEGKAIKIIYLVPTRALISQVERDFNVIKKEQNIDVYISSVPQAPEALPVGQSTLYVFTQERLHWFLTNNDETECYTDYLIVDEAQKIGDGSRGILLQQKIEDLTKVSPEIKILFCSASTENPGVLLEDLSSNPLSREVVTDYVSVNQNLVWVSQAAGNRKEWNMKLCYKDLDIPLGNLSLSRPLSGARKKLPTFAHLLGSKDGGNMIYVNSQYEAEEASKILYELIDETEIDSSDTQINDLIKLSKTLVHSEYLLNKILQKGIAFHYGNMPLVLKDEIENLFISGKIKYLICTSTLLEGVNLPAKSIFMRNPGRGIGNPLSENDFWNLAGRAGRSKMEFQGNIVCIDPEEWNPPRIRTKYKITRALRSVSNVKSGFLDYVANSDVDIEKESKREFEYALTYYYSKFLREGVIVDFTLEVGFLKNLNLELGRIKELVKVPDEIIYRNPGISPLSQQKLLDYFKEYDDDVKKLIPVFPDVDDESNPSEHYRRIINIIHKTLSTDFFNAGINHYRAILVVNWMRGYPLGRIINSNFKYWESKKSSKKLSAVIRDTMSDIEEYVRFQFAKNSSCYTDILKHYLKQEHEDLVAEVPEIGIWIEFGVSQKTHISFISIGLSRHTAIELAKYTKSRNLTRQECIRWLSNEDISIFELPESIKKEVARVKQTLN
jgi:superfamily II DNA/RNA helicase